MVDAWIFWWCFGALVMSVASHRVAWQRAYKRGCDDGYERGLSSGYDAGHKAGANEMFRDLLVEHARSKVGDHWMNSTNYPEEDE